MAIHHALLRRRRVAQTARPRPGHRRRGVVPVALAAAAAGTLLPLTPPASASSSQIIVGAAGQRERLSDQIGRRLASYVFGRLDGPVRDGTLVNFETNGPYRAVASAGPGSATYDHIVRWARGIKANGHHTLVTFQHEPETKYADQYGTGAEFIAAWRRVVSIFRAEGTTNIEWVWTMSAYSFSRNPSDSRYAARYYPGDTYVDYVGADPYNWYRNCGPSTDKWRMLGDITANAVSFARAHGKRVVLPEFATNIDPANPARKAAWIADAHRFLAANRGMFRAVFYFNNSGSRCHLVIDRSDQVAAFRAMVSDPAFTT